MMRFMVVVFLSLFAICSSSVTQADTFGSGANGFEIEFVTIGNPGNAADTTGDPNPAGSVPYTYRIGKYEISEQMIDKANILGGLGISKDTRGPDKPATRVSWLEAAQFVNWLNTSTGHMPAYKFDVEGNFQLWTSSDAGYNPVNRYHNSLARYFLPSIDEWYKAAFYNPADGVYYNYPTGSDLTPTAVASGTAPNTAVYNHLLSQGPADITLAGGLSPYGTMGQGGNVGEWQETDYDLLNNANASNPSLRGGNWHSSSTILLRQTRGLGNPDTNSAIIGFRVVSIVPEPNSFVSSSIGVFAVLCFTTLRCRIDRVKCSRTLVPSHV
jgi:formylglycine-generating enzyme